MSGGRLKAPLSLGGTAVVCCVHDREKRVLRDVDEAIRLGAEHGFVYDPRTHLFQLCPCCENVFVALDDTPRLCGVCSGVPLHQLGGPLPAPIGRVDE